MPVLIKGTGGGGMKVNGVKVRALAAEAVTKGSFLDYVPRTFNPENATPSYVDQVIYLDQNHYLVLMEPTSRDYVFQVREVDQTTGASTVVFTKALGNLSGVGVWRMEGNYLLFRRWGSGTTYVDLYSYANRTLTLVSTLTVSSQYNFNTLQISKNQLFFYYFQDVYVKTMKYSIVTLSGGAITQTTEKTATINHTTYSKIPSMRIDVFDNPRAMVIHWYLQYTNKYDEREPSLDQSGVLSYVFDSNWDMTLITDSRKTSPNALYQNPQYRYRNCMFRYSGNATTVNGGLIYQKVYRSVLNADGSVSEDITGTDNAFLPSGIGTQTEDGDDLYFLQGYQYSFAVCKCTWTGNAFVFQWIRKDRDTYERYKAYQSSSYGPSQIMPVSGFITVNGCRRIAFEFRLRLPVSENSYYNYDKYGTMPIETAYHVRNANMATPPTPANGIVHVSMIALTDAAANTEFDALVFDERDAVEYTQ